MKKRIGIVMAVVVLLSTLPLCLSVSANLQKSKVDGIRWFPCEPGRENDIMWEVECLVEGCGCQGFLENASTTGYNNFLDTVYGVDGSLTITRNGNDGQGVMYWPRIRTLMLEEYPELDIKVANTLYFDFEATQGWNIMLGISGMTLKLSKVISDAAGVGGVVNSDMDGLPGVYRGSVNLQNVLVELSAESNTESSTFARAIYYMPITYVPQISIFVTGDVGASVKLNNLFISTPDDPAGTKCDYLDLELAMSVVDNIAPSTEAPTAPPTEAPTAPPTEAPTAPPTEAPTAPPTEAPTAAPTEAPTAAPTEAPTAAPTEAPTAAPTEAPTTATTVATQGLDMNTTAVLTTTASQQANKNLPPENTTTGGVSKALFVTVIIVAIVLLVLQGGTLGIVIYVMKKKGLFDKPDSALATEDVVEETAEEVAEEATEEVSEEIVAEVTE